MDDLASVDRRLSQLSAPTALTPPAGIEWLEDDQLAARLQSILQRQARQRGIDLS